MDYSEYFEYVETRIRISLATDMSFENVGYVFTAANCLKDARSAVRAACYGSDETYAQPSLDKLTVAVSELR